MSLHVKIVGSGPDLVLLHGWAMHSGIWSGICDRLAQHFRLHLVDLPGHGSSLAHGSGTLQSVVDKVAEILPASCTVCGWSLGGQVAVGLALCVPERVNKLALISTTPCFVSREDWQWGMETTMLQLFMENLRRDYTTTLSRFLTLQVSGSSDTKAMLAQLHASFFQGNEPDEAALQAGLQILLTTDLRTKIKSIQQPVILLHGENDVITNPAAARWMNQQLQNSKLIIVPYCGHAPFLSHPDQFIAGITQAV